MSKKRFTIKLKHPNPLFEEWLQEWRDKAIETDSKKQYCYGKALQSLQKYPLPLASGRDCIILQGFGENLCKMLDEKLAEHKMLQDSVDTPNRAKRKSKEYIPVLNSGPWAILITLYKKSLEPQYPGFMFKPELIKHGQCLSDKSFVKPDPGSYYTAWSSMKTLIEKNLVAKVSSPAKYSLTDDGTLLAHKLYRNKLNNDTLPEDKSNSDVEITKPVRNKKLPTATSKRKKAANSMQSSSSITSKELDSEIESSCSNLTQEESFICLPYSFDIILLVDKMEVSGTRHPLDDTTLSELTNLNVAYEVRHLKVGDYTWICRERSTNKELVLPYIVERKRIDDLGGSIKDGRFYEQKFRLKQCGITNLIYLVESFGNNAYAGLPTATLNQAAINTLLHDGFSVKFTDNIKATIKYFAAVTNILKSLYLGKTLVSCPKENLSQAVNDDDLVSLMAFREFNLGASKKKNLKVQDMFVRMLLQLKGMSVDKAVAIVEKYPSPQSLRLAYMENADIVNEKLLANLEYGKLRKRIGPSISKVVNQLFMNVTY